MQYFYLYTTILSHGLSQEVRALCVLDLDGMATDYDMKGPKER